jgi:hypothetical protein
MRGVPARFGKLNGGNRLQAVLYNRRYDGDGVRLAEFLNL